CTRRRGNKSVPFPFGLEDGCFARKQFHLDCKHTTSSILLAADFIHHVTNIYVDKGLLEYIIADTNNAKADIAIWDNVPRLYVYSEDLALISVEWFVAHITCQEAKQNTSGYACVSDNSECITSKHIGGY
uniref:Wall-associated receptor kinase galacturonan-binding domain-containing protein n=1 Tax=Setaria italica TaxID=4555 RepID=K3ZZC2_SETIT